MKYIVEKEVFRNGQFESGEVSICDSFADAVENAIIFGFAFTKEDARRNTLTLYQAPTIGYIVEECLNETAFRDDGTIDWKDYDPSCVQAEEHGFYGKMIADMVIDAYRGVDFLYNKEDMLDDFSKGALKGLCTTASELGRGGERISIGSGSAGECIDAFNEACCRLNICRRYKDGSSEYLRVNYNW